MGPISVLGSKSAGTVLALIKGTKLDSIIIKDCILLTETAPFLWLKLADLSDLHVFIVVIWIFQQLQSTTKPQRLLDHKVIESSCFHWTSFKESWTELSKIGLRDKNKTRQRLTQDVFLFTVCWSLFLQGFSTRYKILPFQIKIWPNSTLFIFLP